MATVFLIKLFRTNDIGIVTSYREYFLPSDSTAGRSEKLALIIQCFCAILNSLHRELFISYLVKLILICFLVFYDSYHLYGEIKIFNISLAGPTPFLVATSRNPKLISRD